MSTVKTMNVTFFLPWLGAVAPRRCHDLVWMKNSCSLQQAQSSSFSSTSTPRKTLYNKHFSRSFLLNYSAALQDPKDEDIVRRLHDFNCEWLKTKLQPASCYFS